MTGSAFLVQPEAAQETQDSQAILDAIQAELGVGPLSGSPGPGQAGEEATGAQIGGSTPVDEPTGQASRAIKGRGSAVVADGTRFEIPGEQRTRHEAACHISPRVNGSTTTNLPSTESVESREPPKPNNDRALVPDTRRPDLRASQNDAVESQTLKNDKAASARAGPLYRKMEVSQQTPTQLNDDRDYGDDLDDPLASTPTDDKDERTLQPDDTGAVNFGLSELGRPSSQVSEDAGFEVTRGEWRLPDNTSQLLSSHAFTPYKPQGMAPETPALPKNPFGTKPGIAAPFGGTQMFGQTQFSSAMKRISPTSSRPSPHLFHNSISPNIMETSPLKNRANVSSPTDIRTSSPQRLHDVPGTVLRHKHAGAGLPDETPLHSKSTGMGDDMIPGSPTYRRPISSGGREPLSHYEPMKRSQERKAQEDMPHLSLGSDDSDSDDAIRQMKRRRRIERKRAQAAQEMEKVSFTPQVQREPGEQPNRKKRRLLSESDGETNGAQQYTPGGPDRANAQEPGPDLRSSLKATATPVEVVAESSEGRQNNDSKNTGQIDDTPARNEKAADEEMIPATSPVRSPSGVEQPDVPPTSEPEPELPSLAPDLPEPVEDVTEASSLPPPRRRVLATYSRAARQTRRGTVVTSSASDGIPIAITSESLPPLTVGNMPAEQSSIDGARATSGEQAATARTRGQKRRAPSTSPPSSRAELSIPETGRPRRGERNTDERNPLTPSNRVNDGAMDMSSSLTVLSETPVTSSKTTPATQELPTAKRVGTVTQPSPAMGRNLRQRSLRMGARSESPQPVTRLKRPSKRAPRLDSESTDELHHTPSASALERSMAQPRASTTFRQSYGSAHRATRLFEGMFFALSFQSGQSQQQDRAKVEAKITQAGGTILTEGFQELFEPSAVMNTANPVFDGEETLKLTKTGAECGFTALIADTYSRKAKYMQALALGVPCLSPHWITKCLDEEAIVDWETYLLCAGASSVMGNAPRGRRRLPNFSAKDATLASMVEGRLQLLAGQSILVVVDSKKARTEAKQPYIFLAQALGPSVSRVFTTQQAKEALLKYKQAGRPFDWLYIDKKTGTAESILAPEAGTKSRKTRTAQAALPTKGIRILDDELVIQSLILERMLDEKEVNF